MLQSKCWFGLQCAKVSAGLDSNALFGLHLFLRSPLSKHSEIKKKKVCVERHTTKREIEKNLQSIVWLDPGTAFLSYNSDEVHPLLGEKVACAAVSPHMRFLVIPASAVLPTSLTAVF